MGVALVAVAGESPVVVVSSFRRFEARGVVYFAMMRGSSESRKTFQAGLSIHCIVSCRVVSSAERCKLQEAKWR